MGHSIICSTIGPGQQEGEHKKAVLFVYCGGNSLVICFLTVSSGHKQGGTKLRISGPTVMKNR